MAPGTRTGTALLPLQGREVLGEFLVGVAELGRGQGGAAGAGVAGRGLAARVHAPRPHVAEATALLAVQRGFRRAGGALAVLHFLVRLQELLKVLLAPAGFLQHVGRDLLAPLVELEVAGTLGAGRRRGQLAGRGVGSLWVGVRVAVTLPADAGGCRLLAAAGATALALLTLLARLGLTGLTLLALLARLRLALLALLARLRLALLTGLGLTLLALL